MKRGGPPQLSDKASYSATVVFEAHATITAPIAHVPLLGTESACLQSAHASDGLPMQPPRP